MRIIKIKNIQATSDVYCGQTIGAGQYYQLQNEIERETFANDSKVAEHLAQEKITVNDGSDDLTWPKNMNYLYGLDVITVDFPPGIIGNGVLQSTS